MKTSTLTIIVLLGVIAWALQTPKEYISVVTMKVKRDGKIKKKDVKKRNAEGSAVVSNAGSGLDMKGGGPTPHLEGPRETDFVLPHRSGDVEEAPRRLEGSLKNGAIDQ